MQNNSVYIETERQLEQVIATLTSKEILYLDLEFDKNHYRFGFQLCLMQIFDGTTCYLIDPLGELDIKVIFSVLNSPTIKLVCYAADEDMRLMHHLGASPKNICDLSVALKLLNYDSLSLTNALHTFVGPTLLADKKSQQKSNWFTRPISEQQRIYAADDVLYLPALKDKLDQQLQVEQRLEWFRQEMVAYENKDWEDGAVQKLYSSKERKQLSLREWIRFERLIMYREKLAQELDRPSYKVWDKNNVIALCKDPSLVNRWQEGKGKHPKIRIKPIEDEIIRLLEYAEKEIKENNIAEHQSSFPPCSKEEKERKKRQRIRQNQLIDNFFNPVKAYIGEEYGVNFSHYLLSNRRTLEYGSGKLELLPYQRELLLQASHAYQLDIPDFLQTP